MLRVVLGRVVLVVLAGLGLLWPLLSGWVDDLGTTPPSDPVVITDYRATLTVTEDGRLVAQEDITALFPSGRHGIFRYWDLADPSDPGVRYVPTIAGISQDGLPARYETSWESHGRILAARIGDPDRYLSRGEHSYTISYTIPGVLAPPSAGAGASFGSQQGGDDGPPGSVFFWNVVAQGWEMPIRQATVTLLLPSASGRVQCSAAWDQGPCGILGAGTPELVLTASDLPPRSGMTVRAAMAPPPPARSTLPWSVDWDGILGRSVGGVALVAACAGAALVAGIAWSRLSREEPPGFPVQYAPPEGLGPVQVVYMHTEGTGPEALTATLLHLADRGLVVLDRTSKDRWTITGTGAPQQWEAADPVGQAVADSLGLRLGGTFSASRRSVTSGRRLKAASDGIGAAVGLWAAQARLVRTAPSETAGRIAWGASVALAVLGFTGLLGPTMWGVPAAAFAVGSASLLATGVGRRRTVAGRIMWSRAGGFQRLLATPSAGDRFDFAARKDLFIAYIPYAVAFGVADRWAEKYRMAVGTEPPVPVWYPVYPGSSSSLYSRGGRDSFSSTMAASISAYTASQSSSSGGGGGGGGFGGGGGGGSW